MATWLLNVGPNSSPGGCFSNLPRDPPPQLPYYDKDAQQAVLMRRGYADDPLAFVDMQVQYVVPVEEGRVCAICAKVGGREAEVDCPGCRAIVYCSRECLKRDRKVHATICRQISSLGENPGVTPKGEHYHLGGLFAMQKEGPELTWVKCSCDGMERENLIDASLLGGEKRPLRTIPLQRDLGTGTRYVRPLIVYYREWELEEENDGDKQNQSVLGLDSSTLPAQVWPSSLLVMCQPTARSLKFEDIRPEHMRILANFFAIHTRENPGWDTHRQDEWFDELECVEGTTTGIIISCDASINLGRPKYIERKVLLTHRIFWPASYCVDLSIQIESPMCIAKLPRLRSTSVNVPGKPETATTNQEASWVSMRTRRSSDRPNEDLILEWGLPDAQYTTDIGDVMVVRQDNRPLVVAHVEAFAKFCKSQGEITYKNIRDRILRDGLEYKEYLPFTEDVKFDVNKNTFSGFYGILAHQNVGSLEWMAPPPFYPPEEENIYVLGNRLVIDIGWTWSDAGYPEIDDGYD